MRRAATCALVALLLLPAPGAAQDDLSASESAVARQYFRSGVTAANAEQWQEAAANFERAYALVRRPLVLLNLALARERLGRLVSAAETYRQFISDASSERERGYVRDAETAAVRIEARLAHLRLDLPGITPEERVELSGRSISQLVLDVEIPLDPGRYEIVVRSGSEVRRRAVITLAEREHRALTLAPGEIAADPARTTSTPAPPPPPRDRQILDADATLDGDGDIDRTPRDTGEDEGGTVLSSPWFWTALAIVAIGATVTIVLLTRDGSADPWPGGDAPAVRF